MLSQFVFVLKIKIKQAFPLWGAPLLLLGVPLLGVPRRLCLASMDSDLEAFSRNPTDDSFVAVEVVICSLPNI
jgi:hypothetical protein